jgi:CDP-paratose 2-epimerase
MRVLVTGGAGFVGANIAATLAGRRPDWEIVAFDNLRRRGSELNVPRLQEAGVTFAHGDVRQLGDLTDLGEIGAVVECSAEPSVLAGLDKGLDYLVGTNLLGAYNCLELARRDSAQVVFLSTSRVYPVAALNGLAYAEDTTRFELADEQPFPGASAEGIAESFPLDGARTLYGATKLAAELLIAEYAETFGLRAVVDRFGVIAGPWQMGKVDQGVFTYWLLGHYFRQPLTYLGFGGAGKQVRDLIHVDDVVDFVQEQLDDPDQWAGLTLNVGGGRACSLSLLETTELCRELTGNTVEIGSSEATRPGDVPLYISDCRLVFSHTDWQPRRGTREILSDIFKWVSENEVAVRRALEYA